MKKKQKQLTQDPSVGLEMALRSLESVMMIDAKLLKQKGVTHEELLAEIRKVVYSAHSNISEFLRFFAEIQQEMLNDGSLDAPTIQFNMRKH